MADDADSPASAKDRAAPGRASVRSADLFAGRREVIIVHGADEYRLRITRAGKLILTK
jgi:hemin uptake protein HemP